MKIRLWGGSADMTEAQLAKMAKRIRKNGDMPKDTPIEFAPIPADYQPTAAEMQKSKRGGVDGGT